MPFVILCISLVTLLCTIAIPLLIGVLVYGDANKRVDCNPWLWALIAALGPSFVGLIIYLIIRDDHPCKPEYTTYDQFGNPIPKKGSGLPAWAKVLLIVFAILFVVLLLGGCAAAIYSTFAFVPSDLEDLLYYF